jgi:nucleoside-diphosphate-sugar epimerase
MTDGEVVVTGAAGFIGRWVVRELLDREYTVTGLDNFSNGSRRNIDEFQDDSDVSTSLPR